jgi:hypothetical protein
MSILYKDLVFESNKTDNYMMDLCMLPEGVAYGAQDIYLTGDPQIKVNTF